MFVVYRTDPSRRPSCQSTGGPEPHPTPARTRTHARTHTHAPTRKETRNETPRARTRTHARAYARTHTHPRTHTHTHTHAHTPARVYLYAISFALCSLCKCYSGAYLCKKTPLNAYQGGQQFARLPLFCGLSMVNPSFFFYPTPPQPLPFPLPNQKKYTFCKSFFPSVCLANTTLSKKDCKKVYFFIKYICKCRFLLGTLTYEITNKHNTQE